MTREFAEAILVIAHLADVLSVSILKRKNHFSFVSSCLVSTVFSSRAVFTQRKITTTRAPPCLQKPNRRNEGVREVADSTESSPDVSCAITVPMNSLLGHRKMTKCTAESSSRVFVSTRGSSISFALAWITLDGER